MIEVKEGAIFVADAHYASYRPLFKKLIDLIESGEIQTPQLFLMGDVFDLLMGPIKAFTKAEQKIVSQLQTLSQRLEIIYLEGNHDFQLKSIFPDMKIITLKDQPVQALYNGKEGYLAHGDWNEGLLYRIYSLVIRNRFFLYFLHLCDTLLGGKLSLWFRTRMSRKKICHDFEGFESYIVKKFQRKDRYNGWFVEGHYHQGSSFFVDGTFYHNLSAMACNKSYFVVQSSDKVISLVSHTL